MGIRDVYTLHRRKCPGLLATETEFKKAVLVVYRDLDNDLCFPEALQHAVLESVTFDPDAPEEMDAVVRSDLRKLLGSYFGRHGNPKAAKERARRRALAAEWAAAEEWERRVSANLHILAIDETERGNEYIVDPDDYHKDYDSGARSRTWRRTRRLVSKKPTFVCDEATRQYAWKLPKKRRKRGRKRPQLRKQRRRSATAGAAQSELALQ